MILVFRFGAELIKVRVVKGVYSMQSRQTGDSWITLEQLGRFSKQSGVMVEELRKRCLYMPEDELRFYLIGECVSQGGVLVSG